MVAAMSVWRSALNSSFFHPSSFSLQSLTSSFGLTRPHRHYRLHVGSLQLRQSAVTLNHTGFQFRASSSLLHAFPVASTSESTPALLLERLSLNESSKVVGEKPRRKIREVGPLTVSIVEELRKSFAPGTQPLQHDTILKELNNWKLLASIDVNSSSLYISVANERTANDEWMERNGKASLSPRFKSFRKKKGTGREGQSGDNDSNDDGDDDEDWHPLLREFPTYHAKEEAIFFYNLFAFPWQKYAFERYVSKLEAKFFPDDLLDFDKPSLASRRRRNECSGTSQNVVFGNDRMTKHKEDGPPSLNNSCNQSSFSASGPNSSLDEGIKGSKVWKKGQEQVSEQMIQSCIVSDPKLNHSKATLGPINNLGGAKKHSLRTEPRFDRTTCNNPGHNGDTPKQKGFSTLARQPVEELRKAVRNQASVEVSMIGEPYLLTKTKRLPLNWDGDMGTVVPTDKLKDVPQLLFAHN